jgi:adenine-specific DNA-methyltransferase
MSKKQRLELTWIGKENRPRLEPRILLEEPEHSYHASHRVTDADLFDNRVIHGDNLLALKALEQEFSGAIKCIYIDPPFNTQQAFDHYDDSIEHSLWLGLMRDRLELLRRLLSNTGTLYVHIDDNELGYLIVLLDEIFGRENRINIITFKQGSATGHKSINPGCVTTTNYLLSYAKNKAVWTSNRVFTARERDDRYNQYIDNIDAHYSCWTFTTLTKAFASHKGLAEKDARNYIKSHPQDLDRFVTDNAGQVIRFARPSYEGVSAEARRLIDESKADKTRVIKLERKGFPDFYLKGGERVLFYRDKLKSIDGRMITGEPLTTLWDDILSNNLHAEGGVEFPKGKKPEGLIKRVLELSTEKGDWVLDSFAGSGTTGAVAHKMGRRWIMVELGDHWKTHVIPRIRRVIDGVDKSGVTEALAWRGGGGYRCYKLAPSLLEKDKWGRLVISKAYNAEMLAEALCKLEGFTYAPSDSVYWQHGQSTERDFLYVTTQILSRDQLQELSDDVGPERSLLVLCSAFRGRPDQFPNLTVKKIPKQVEMRCEWGHDDYSLKVENLAKAPPKPGQQQLLFGEESKR